MTNKQIVDNFNKIFLLLDKLDKKIDQGFADIRKEFNQKIDQGFADIRKEFNERLNKFNKRISRIEKFVGMK